MPTFDLGDISGSVIVLMASLLAGIAIGAGFHVFATTIRDRAVQAAPSGVVPRRPRTGRPTGGLAGIAIVFLPTYVLIARGFPGGFGRDRLVELYERAGWPGGLEDDELPGIALMAGVLVAGLGGTLLFLAGAAFTDYPLPTIVPLAIVLGMLLIATGPGMVVGWLTRRAESRDREITRTMPFVLDLLVLTMRAGAPLNTAMERVVIDYSGHPVGTEFRAVLADMEMGVTKRDALEGLAARNPIPAVRTFADDLNQAEELGRPVADTLERLADRSRVTRVQDATETAGKAKVLVLIPGMLVFVAALLLLFAPFAVRYFYGGYSEF